MSASPIQRLTIGVLTGWQVFQGAVENSFVSDIFDGIHTAAHETDCNLLFSCGVGRDVDRDKLQPAWPIAFPENDFVPIGPWNTDGLLVIVPVRHAGRMDYLRQLRIKGFPLHFIGIEPEEFPAVYVDNEAGIRMALMHLAGHGHERIAFLSGDPQDLGDSLQRLQAYRQSIHELSLVEDEALIVEAGHRTQGGYQATQQLIRSGVPFTAILGSNDLSQLGALQALQESGLRVPQDVALVGFDDTVECQLQSPPLTSVRYPRFSCGYQAFYRLLTSIRQGEEALKEAHIQLRPALIPRQSCGCSASIPTVSYHVPLSEELVSVFPNLREPAEDQGLAILAGRMIDILGQSQTCQVSAGIYQLCEQMLQLLRNHLENGDVLNFAPRFASLVEKLEHLDCAQFEWQAIINMLRKTLPQQVGLLDTFTIDQIFDIASQLLMESTYRQMSHQIWRWTSFLQQLSLMTMRFLSAHDEAQVMEIFFEELPNLGIQQAWVGFYLPDAGNPFENCLMWHAENGQVRTHETRACLFFDDLASHPGDPIHLSVLPLYFQDELMGFVAFRSDTRILFGAIVRELAAALKSAHLYQETLSLSLTDPLTGLHNRRFFDLFLKQETERSRRYQRGLSVILIDIDHLKQINDRFGHQIGDEALIACARIIQQHVRRGIDVASRWGGDEFAIILPETSATGALQLAQIIRGSIARDQTVPELLSASLGVASADGEAIDGPRLLRMADQALYQAKENRNTAVLFQ